MARNNNEQQRKRSANKDAYKLEASLQRTTMLVIQWYLAAWSETIFHLDDTHQNTRLGL